MSLYDLPKELLIKIITNLQEADCYVIKITKRTVNYGDYRLQQIIGPYYSKEKAYEVLRDLLGDNAKYLDRYFNLGYDVYVPDSGLYKDSLFKGLDIDLSTYSISKLKKPY